MTRRTCENARDPWANTVALLASACFAWCGTTGAQALKPADIAGRVVDEKGAAVASAKVWVIGGSWHEPKNVAEATADSQGSFSFPGFWDEQDRSGALQKITHSYSLAAHDSTGRLGWITVVYRGIKMPVSIALAAAHEAKGRVVDTVGKPIAGAEIVPVIFERSHAQARVQRLPSSDSRARRPPRRDDCQGWFVRTQGHSGRVRSARDAFGAGFRCAAGFMGLETPGDDHPRWPAGPRRRPADHLRRQGASGPARARHPAQLATGRTCRRVVRACLLEDHQGWRRRPVPVRSTTARAVHDLRE